MKNEVAERAVTRMCRCGERGRQRFAIARSRFIRLSDVLAHELLRGAGRSAEARWQAEEEGESRHLCHAE
jgi:hypothetical protein